jgi:aminomethyltransferase
MEFFISGPMLWLWIQETNDASTLTVGKAQYSCLPNDQGGIVDDLLIYKLKKKHIY